MITVKCKGDNEVIGVSMNKFKGMKEGDIIELVHDDGRLIRLVTVSDVGAPCTQCYILDSMDKCPHIESNTLMCSLFPRSYSLVKAEDLI
jgi:hypothetical protein